MPLYLDVEFNSFRGQTISLAMAHTNGAEFYEVLPAPKNIHPWVAQNVMPILNKPAIQPITFRLKLWHFLLKYNGESIYADWPEDFAHLMQWSCAENGKAPNLRLTMHLIKSGAFEPEQRHNALSDAHGLKKWCEENNHG